MWKGQVYWHHDKMACTKHTEYHKTFKMIKDIKRNKRYTIDKIHCDNNEMQKK